MNSIVVADAGPLHYLILIDSAEKLQHLFNRTNFFVSPEFLEAALERDRVRKEKRGGVD